MSEIVAQSYLGTLTNKDLVRDFLIDDVKAATKIKAGQCTTLDAALGRITTVATAVDGALVRITEVGADNTNGVLGDKKIQTFKSGAICIVQAGAAIDTVGVDLQAGADGKMITLVSGNQSYRVANFLGKINTVGEVGKNPEAAADDDLILVRVY